MPVPPLLFLLARGRAAVTGSGHEGPVVDRARCLPVVLLADQGDVVHAGGAGGVVAAAGVFRAGLGVGVPGDVVRGRGPGILSVAPYEQDVQVEWVEDELHAPAGQRRVDLVLVSVQGNQGRLGDGPPFGPAERLGQIRFGWERERAAGFPAGQRRLPGLRMLPDVVDRLGPGGEQLVQLGQVLDPGGALLGQLDQELIPCGPEEPFYFSPPFWLTGQSQLILWITGSRSRPWGLLPGFAACAFEAADGFLVAADFGGDGFEAAA